MTTNENYKSYSDSIIEEMWQALDDVPFDEQANGEMILSEKWLSFDEGTTLDDIWHWFDKHYSKGVYELLYGDKESFIDCTHSYEELCALFDKIVPLSKSAFDVFDCEDNTKNVLEKSAEPCLLFGFSIPDKALTSVFDKEDVLYIKKDKANKGFDESVGYITVKKNSEEDFEYLLVMDAGITRPVSECLLEKILKDSIEGYISFIENCKSSLWLNVWFDNFQKEIVEEIKKETSAEKLTLYAQNKNIIVRQAVAISLNTPDTTLAMLAEDKNESVRQLVARNRNISLSLLAKLAKDESPDVRKEVTDNAKASAEILTLLAKDKDKYVRKAVAWNENTPPETLAELVTEEDYSIRQAVASNPNTSGKTLSILANDEHSNVRINVAFNANTPPEALAKLAEDDDLEVRNTVADNPQMSSKTIETLADNKDNQIGRTVKNNKER